MQNKISFEIVTSISVQKEKYTVYIFDEAYWTLSKYNYQLIYVISSHSAQFVDVTEDVALWLLSAPWQQVSVSPGASYQL